MFPKPPAPFRKISRCVVFLPMIWSCLAHAQEDETGVYKQVEKLLEASRMERDRERRDGLLSEAEEALRGFLRENPEHIRAHAARAQLGNLLVERARLQLTHGAPTSSDNNTKARRFYEQAYDVFQRDRAVLRTQLESLTQIDLTNREQVTRRDRLRADYLQARLLMAAVLEESAETHQAGGPERGEILKRAATEYGEIHDAYRTKLAGLYARMYQGRCLLKQMQHKDALACLEPLFEMPDSPKAFRVLKTKTLLLALPCWLDDSQRKYQRAASRGDQWLEKTDEREAESPDGLEIRFLSARAHQLLAEAADEVEAAAHRDKAISLAKFVARRPGAFQNVSRQLLVEFGASE